ncbi:MAG: PilN domain-containing protein [Thermodesulfobacteriota bacterium]
MEAPGNNQPTEVNQGTSGKPKGKALGRLFLLSLADDRIWYKKTLCLAIEKGGVSVSLGRRFFSKIRISGLKYYPCPGSEYPPPEFVTSCLGLATTELQAGGVPVVLSLPKSWAVIRTADYPSTVLENLSNVLGFELDRITPFNPETAYFDFHTIKEDASRITVLVAAVRMDVADPYLKVLREKGITVEQVTINLLGFGTLSRFLQKQDPVIFLNIEENQYEGLLYLPESLLKVFSGPFPNEDRNGALSRIEKDLESILAEAGGVGKIKEVYCRIKEGDPFLKERIPTRMRWPVHFLGGSDPAFNQILGLKPGEGPIPCSALGGLLEALWTKALGLNLLRKGRRKKIRPPLVLTLLLLILFGIMIGVYWLAPMEAEKKRLQDIEKQIAAQKGEIKKIETLKKEVDSVFEEIEKIHSFKTTNPLSLNLLKELTLILPKNSWLTRVRISESQVNIEGYSPSATPLIPRLDASRYFRKVEFSAPTFRDPRQNMDRFQIKMEIEGREDEKK